MLIDSKYPGICNACGKSYPVGARIDWVKGVKGALHAACSNTGKATAAKVAESRATDADVSIACPEGLSFLPYQRAGIAYAMTRQSCLIADEMGLGKTVQAIGVANTMPEAKAILVVCPASLKHNWRAEFRKWNAVKNRTIGIFPRRESVTIVNYEQLKKINPQAWDLLVLDEAHYAKNPTAQRTQECIKHAKLAKRVVALTGTPLDKPKEIYTLLTMLDSAAWGPPGVKRSKEEGRFLFRYTNPTKVWNGSRYITSFEGAANLEELQERLRSSLMVRRLKADVLAELPAKRRQIVVLGEQKDDGFALNESGDYQEQVDALRKSGKVAFEEISGLRHEQALRKLPKCIEYLTETLQENSDKVVVFAHHKDVIAELEIALAPFGTVTIDGSTPVADRGGIVEAFQTGNARVFIGSIGAAGVGLTLTAASRVVFVELDWTPKAMNQAEDRCHRIGQKDTVLVQHLVIDGTLDAKIAKLLVQKQEVADKALDRTLSVERPVPAPSTIREEIAFTSCTCLAAPDGSNGHASWCDMFMQIPAMIDAAPVENVSRETPKPALTETEIAKIHEALRSLADACDGARTKDSQGFNRFDSSFGCALARRPFLTEKQALAARRMLRKYRGQIGDV